MALGFLLANPVTKIAWSEKGREGLAFIIPRGICSSRLHHVRNPYAASVRANLLPVC